MAIGEYAFAVGRHRDARAPRPALHWAAKRRRLGGLVIVDRISREDDGEALTLSARVRTSSLGGAEFEMWFRIPSPQAPGGPLDASPFLPPLFLMCMFTGEPLAIDGPVSTRLLGATGDIADVCCSFWPDRMRPVPVDAPAQDVAGSRGGYGCFFTRGVDSWYSVLTEPGFTHLLHLTAFHPPQNRDARRRALDRACAVLPHVRLSVPPYPGERAATTPIVGAVAPGRRGSKPARDCLVGS